MENLIKNSISPFEEMVAYETLWAMEKSSPKVIAQKFRNYETTELPTKVLEEEQKEDFLVKDLYSTVRDFLQNKNSFSVMVYGGFQYPNKLRDAEYPLELFYYKGNIELVTTKKTISIVGARNCSEEGKRRAKKIARLLVEKGYTIVSGLAKGIDTAALTGALEARGKVIAVIGTPIDEYYPKENKELQDYIASHHLLLSQVPFYKYKNEHFKARRYYFPERNKTMSALSEATIIVEASDRSGTLTQARACFKQKRPLFILNSCFENPDITWPHNYSKRDNVYRVQDINDIIQVLEQKQL